VRLACTERSGCACSEKELAFAVGATMGHCTLTAETSAVAVESDKLGAGQGSRFSLDVAVRCQSARKFDPSSASNLPRVLLVALGSSALTGIAETRRVRVA
jgi:hypothetical protein